MIDTHCHLTHARFADDLDAVLARATEAGVARCVTIGTGAEDARRARELASRVPQLVSFAAGVDPFTGHRVGAAFDDELAAVREVVLSGAVAVGEVGLDYHYDLGTPPEQAARLVRQLDLARELDLPVVLHVREAHDDLIEILAHHPASRGVVHSFTAGPREAARYVELGWHLAFNGVLGFPNAPAVRDAAREVPLDRLLVETDAPFLAPLPVRGRRCEPAHVAHTLQKLAEVRGAEVELLRESTSDNARRLFELPV